MGGVIALAAPHFLPTILYSTHEGAARHLANFGRAAAAEAALARERLFVRIDLDQQEYWCERMPPPEEEAPLHAALADDDHLPDDDGELEAMAQAELDKRDEGAGTDDGDKVLEEQSTRMAEESNTLARRTLVAQAGRVRHDERVLPHSARERLHPSLADQLRERETVPEELSGPLLGRTRLPDEVRIEWIKVGGVEQKHGVATVEFSAAGLDVDAQFLLTNQEGHAFLVTWDPIAGMTIAGEEAAQ
jgi:hypothetical protein